MTRRTALATAGALTIVLLAGVAAATNLGLLRMTGDSGQVGRLSPAGLAPAGVMQQSPAADDATASSDGGRTASGPGDSEEPGDTERFGDDLQPGAGTAAGGGASTREHFQGRGDDD